MEQKEWDDEAWDGMMIKRCIPIFKDGRDGER